jgi:Molecular chaperone, HSP90 family
LEHSKITISGNIISELSEKIPSNIIALNELLKNSYDAGAPSVTVTLNSTEKKLIVKDDGAGMDKADIDTLFHISNSEKKYGTLNKFGRITQGSKGLGFLSVFKFGKKVKWETRKSNGLRFNVDFDMLVASRDISNFEIEIEEDNTIEKGTTITIELDEYNLRSLETYLSEEKNYKKILYSFNDSKFAITLNLNTQTYNNKQIIDIKKIEADSQLFYITYNSSDQKIIFYYNGYELMNEEFKFFSHDYSLSIELAIYQLAPYGKSKIDPLFYNGNNELTPLNYVNGNLFNNYDIFDPNIMKNIKTTLVLNQMIGYICINSSNKDMNFNSDRSQFLQNELTDSIKNFLYDVNRHIQVNGSSIKKHLADFDILTTTIIPAEYTSITDVEKFRKFIKDDFYFKSIVNIVRVSDKVEFSLFGKSKTAIFRQVKPKPATIKLSVSKLSVSVPSNQIDLKEYIESAYNSAGSSISKDDILVFYNGEKLENGILNSIEEPSEIKVEYQYNDSVTGLLIQPLAISFYRPSSHVTGKGTGVQVITLPSKESYNITYNGYVGNLINQINSLNIPDYVELIACSIRSIFEISVDCISKSAKFSSFYAPKISLDEKVIQVIEYIKNNKKYMQYIAQSTKIEYTTIDNFLDAEKYKSGISSAHLGAHKSGTYIGVSDVEHLAKLVGFFVVMINEMLNNSQIC